MNLDERLSRFEKCLEYLAGEHPVMKPTGKYLSDVFAIANRILKGKME